MLAVVYQSTTTLNDAKGVRVTQSYVSFERQDFNAIFIVHGDTVQCTS